MVTSINDFFTSKLSLYLDLFILVAFFLGHLVCQYRYTKVLNKYRVSILSNTNISTKWLNFIPGYILQKFTNKDHEWYPLTIRIRRRINGVSESMGSVSIDFTAGENRTTRAMNYIGTGAIASLLKNLVSRFLSRL